MADVMNWNVGSISEFIQSAYPDVPSAGIEAISGTKLGDIVRLKQTRVERITGVAIGSPTIVNKYIDPLQKMTVADVARKLDMQGIDNAQIKLGDFSASTTGETNLARIADALDKEAVEELQGLAATVQYEQTFG